MRHLQHSFNIEQRRLSNVRDVLDKEMQSFEKLLKSEVKRELAKSRANLAEAAKANTAFQQEVNKDKSLMRETASKLRDREDEVYDELKSELNTLRENSVQRERKQFMEPENLERLEGLNKEKDGEINSFIIEVPAEKICVERASPLGAVAVGVDANLSKKDGFKSVVEEINFVANVNFLETGGYVAKEFAKDVAIGDNLSLMQITGIT